MGHPEWKPQRAVFVADDDQGIWIVENPEAVRNFPAAHVVLAGKFNALTFLAFLKRLRRTRISKIVGGAHREAKMRFAAEP